MEPTLQGEELVMLMVMPAFFLITGWAFRTLLVYLQTRRSMKFQYELQSKLLERFGSAPELLDYVKSDAGLRFIESSMTEPRANPHARILGSMQTGTVLAALGVGFLVLRPLLPDAAQPFAVFGVLSLCVGAGFLGSAWVSTALARRWGLIAGQAGEADAFNA